MQSFRTFLEDASKKYIRIIDDYNGNSIVRTHDGTREKSKTFGKDEGRAKQLHIDKMQFHLGVKASRHEEV